MFIVAEEAKRNALAAQFLCRLPLTEDHAEWRVVLNAIEILINHGNTEVFLNTLCHLSYSSFKSEFINLILGHGSFA